MSFKYVVSMLFLAILVFSQIAMASNAVIAYAGPGSVSPRLKFWDSSGSGSWGSEVSLTGSASAVTFAIIKASPVSQKLVLVTLDTNGNLNGYVCMSNCNVSGNWNLTTAIGDVQSDAERRFDLEFENSTGDAIVVYGVYSTNGSRDLAYKVLPNATTSFSGITEQYLDDTEHANGNVYYTWVRLDRKPTASEELLLIGNEANNNHANAWVWNGNAFNNQTNISLDTAQTGGFEAVAVRYAADGSKGMAISGDTNSGNVTYKYWNGASWSSASSQDINSSNGNDVYWMNLKADPATDDLQLVIVDSNSDLYTAYWDGAAWTFSSRIEDDLAHTGPNGDVRPVDFAWNPSGSTGKLVWENDSSSDSLRQRDCSPQCTGTISTLSGYGNDTRFITLYRNPTDADLVNILGARLSEISGSNYDLGSFSFNGTGYANYGDTAITSTPLTDDYESYSIAFMPPAQPSVSILKLNQTTIQASPGGKVQFNITVTNTGGDPLNGTVRDVLPVGLTFASASPLNTSGPWTFTNLGAGASLVYYLNATVNAGVVNASTPVRNLTNYVNVTAKPPTGSNVTAESRANVTVYYSNITVVKVDITPIEPISPGGLVQWRINVSNPGAVDLATVFVTDTLPAGFYCDDTAPAALICSAQLANWTVTGLTAGGYTLLYLNSTVDSSITPGTYTNNVQVVGIPPNGNNVTGSHSAQIGINDSAITVTKSANPSFVQPNDTNVTYTLVITNTGEVDLNVTVIDTLPANVTFRGANVTPSPSTPPAIIWDNVVTLAPWETFSIAYNVSTNVTGTYQNFVVVTGVPPNGDSVSANDSATFTASTTPPPSPTENDNEGEQKPPLSLRVASSCNGTVVTVTGEGKPVNGATVVVIDTGSLYTVFTGTTNSSGQVTFEGCSMEVKVYGRKSGYVPEDTVVMLTDCGQCAPVPPECEFNSDCAADESCHGSVCTAVPCQDGEVVNHECVQYECTSDSNCGSGQTCEAHRCVTPSQPACVLPCCDADADCSATQYCKMTTTAPNGVCTEVTGCGTVENHALVPYACGSEVGCPSCQGGQKCENHVCVAQSQLPPTGAGTQPANRSGTTPSAAPVVLGGFLFLGLILLILVALGLAYWWMTKKKSKK